MQMFWTLSLSLKCPFFLWFFQRKHETSLNCCMSSAQICVSQIEVELLRVESFSSIPEPIWAKGGGWSYCSLSVLGTTPPRHMERGRDAVKVSTSWGEGCVCLSECQKLHVVWTHFCACVRIHSPAVADRGHSPHPHPLLWLKASWGFKCKVHSGKTQWWFLHPSTSGRSLTWASQHFNLLPGGEKSNIL